MEMDLGRVCVQVAIETPVDVVAIDVMERIHPEFAPLDLEPSALGIGEPIAETDPQFRGGDGVVVRCFVDGRFEVEPQVTNPPEGRKIDRSELAGAGCSASPFGGRLLVETAEQLGNVGAVLPTPMGADRREQCSSRFGAQMAVPSVVDDEPWCRDDPWAL